MTFLSEIINQLIDNQNNIPFEKTVIVIPNQRAKRMLHTILSNEARVPKPCFAPRIITINDFIESLSPYEHICQEELTLLLFKIYVEKSTPETVNDFNKFIGWVSNFLGDINEIDLQIVNASEILSNIKDIKELETSFGKDELSKNQKKYLEFYESLLPLYTEFRKRLKEAKQGYEGMIYRDVAENIAEYASKSEEERFIFAGFHALSESEIQIIEYFYKHKTTEFLFDIDNLYQQYYAPFVKRLQDRLHLAPISYKNDFAEIPKEIYITGVSKKMSQIYHAIDIIHEIEEEQRTTKAKEELLSNTVLVFADESLLIPFIHAYDSKKANFTMGFPFSSTSASQLIETIFALVKNMRRFNIIKNSEEEAYYHKDVIAFLQNKFISKYFFVNSEEVKLLINSIIQKNYIFISPKDQDLKKFFVLLNFDKKCSFIHNLSTFLTALKSKIPEDEYLDKYFIQTILENIESIKAIEEEFASLNIPFDLGVIQYFLNEKLASVSLPFKGDFAQGLQIMGLLETRSLDFENVIILSVNEGNLPKGKGTTSLIMYDVKQHFHLPTYYEKDSIFAYHFFRLLQRAKRIHLIYDNDSSDTLAEKSRFISQLEFEIKKRELKNISLHKNNLSISPTMQKKREIVVKKNPSIIEKIEKIKFSPSSLQTYINCPLQFYYSRVERIEVPQEVNENVESKVIGTIIHNILEATFNEIKANRIQYLTILQDKINNLDNIITKAFKGNEDIGDSDITRGKNFIATQIVNSYLLTFLEKSKEELQDSNILVEELEYKFDYDLPFASKSLKLIGTADRIDRKTIPIIYDYKTGKVDQSKLQFTDMETLFHDPDQKQLFQLLYYSFIYCKSKNICTGEQDSRQEIIKSGIIAFQQLSKNSPFIIYPLLKEGKRSASCLEITSSLLQEFEDNLVELFQEILDPEKDFDQVQDEDRCKYCDFKKICQREQKEKKH